MKSSQQHQGAQARASEREIEGAIMLQYASICQHRLNTVWMQSYSKSYAKKYVFQVATFSDSVSSMFFQS